MRIAAIILAAGSSSRLGGEPKQLLRHNGTSLVRRMANIALSLHVGPVVVVLGANGERVREELMGLPLITPVNADWAEGLASSLRVGLTALADDPIDAFLILLTDQPYVTADLLRQLIDKRQHTGRGIVACRYRTGRYAGAAPVEPAHLGVPALFDNRYKPAFFQFTGDVGARKLIRQYPADCAEVPFPLGTVDLDTPEDVATWQLSLNRTSSES
ncbi:MAG TPA: nucleotidyltransferase family protein [Spirosoma sp.]|nr:nucleotidyltransferase family protein [Spirosoma sp.]